MKLNCKAVIDFEENSVFSLNNNHKYLLVNVDGPNIYDYDISVKYNLINLTYGNRYCTPATEQEMIKILNSDEFVYLGKFTDIFKEK